MQSPLSKLAPTSEVTQPELMRGHSQLRKGRFSGENQIYHISTATHSWQPLFSNFNYGRVLVNCLRYETENRQLETLAFVVMPDHLHWLFSLGSQSSLSECVKNVKTNATRRINRLRGRQGRVWMTAYYDRAIRKEEDLAAVARYIVANPLRAGLVRSVRDYPLWDAKWI